jgi:hypothetical protein
LFWRDQAKFEGNSNQQIAPAAMAAPTIPAAHPLLKEITAYAFSEDEAGALAVAAGQPLFEAKRLERALVAAAALGWAEAMREVVARALEAGARLDAERALEAAAMEGHVEAMRAARALGAWNVNKALGWAARCGHMAALRKLKEWGATDFSRAIESAVKGRQWAAEALLRQWLQAHLRARHEWWAA